MKQIPKKLVLNKKKIVSLKKKDMRNILGGANPMNTVPATVKNCPPISERLCGNHCDGPLSGW